MDPDTSLYPASDESSPQPQVIYLRYILILNPNLRLGLPSDLIPSGFLTKILYALSLSVLHILHIRTISPLPFPLALQPDSSHVL
jgi:hypothetical protein